MVYLLILCCPSTNNILVKEFRHVQLAIGEGVLTKLSNFDARCQPRWGSPISPVPTRAFSGSMWSSHPLPRPGIIRHLIDWLM